MTEKTAKIKITRASKSKRAHIRKMKSEARKAGTVYKPEVL